MSEGGPYWLGADPGGSGAFGIAKLYEDGRIETACVSCADEAVARIDAEPLGVGIDAPLWWSSGPSSDRAADQWIRRTYGIRSGTVQAVNSLRGAALVQGALLVVRLRERFPTVRVTETHPKAVAIALGGWNAPAISGLDMTSIANEHERDAALAAIAAREGFSGRWTRDLSLTRHASEQNPQDYWLAPVHYFWPAT